MNKLNAIIIEDEVPAARLLHSMITRLRPQWTLTIIPGSVDEAVAWFKDNPQPDLIFLDIQLADGNAFDFLSAVHPSSIIIFNCRMIYIKTRINYRNNNIVIRIFNFFLCLICTNHL